VLVCVTGGTGFIGRRLVRGLLADGVQVRVLARPASVVHELESLGAEIIRGDLSDLESITEAVDGAEVVYHLAARVDTFGSLKYFTQTNVAGTQNVFRASIRKEVPHVVYLSSIAVFGEAKRGKSINDDTGLEVDRLELENYVQSKIEAEEYATAIGVKTSLAITILRPGTVFGPGRPLPAVPLEYSVAEDINLVFGRRERHFPLIYVENLVDAIVLAGRRTGGGLKRYIVIDDDDLTIGTFCSTRGEIQNRKTHFLPGWPMLLAAIGRLIIMIILTRGLGSSNWWRKVRGNLQDRRYESRRIREETGWEPKVQLREAIERTVSSESGTR
jgi:nucleoside-diphosphate-sugar epimerase